MFGFCVWYTLNRDHKIASLVKSLSYVFKTDLFQPHITVSCSLKRRDAEAEFLKVLGRVKPWFQLVGVPYMTKTENFYAIQHDCIMNGVENFGNFHISLAYRVDKPFTDSEIQQAHDFLPIQTIFTSDSYVSLNDCRALMPRHWIQLKREP